MTPQQQTIPVPVDVAQATVNVVAELPVGKVGTLFAAWQQIIEMHNRAAQAQDRPLDAAETNAVADVLKETTDA